MWRPEIRVGISVTFHLILVLYFYLHVHVCLYVRRCLGTASGSLVLELETVVRCLDVLGSEEL